jgi:UDP-N-acetylmuramoyl-tripeptide--D-alanyl-D-alanine ligase
MIAMDLKAIWEMSTQRSIMLARHFRELKQRIGETRALRHRRSLGDTRFVAVVGSQGKTTAAKLTHHFLSTDGPVLLSAYRNDVSDTQGLLMKVRRNDRYAVFELAENSSETRDRLADALTIVQPHIVLVTLLANDHYAEFRSKEAAAAQIAKAVRAVEPGGMVVLNADDPFVLDMKNETAARVVTYGESDFADYRATDIEVAADGWLRFNCHFGGEIAPFEIRILGRHFLASVLGAIAIALENDIPLASLVERARSHEPVPGRCSLHHANDGTIFVCDTVKAVYETLEPSFAVSDAFQSARRRTIIIGTISDYSGSARPRYQKAYLSARDHADRVIMYGPNAYRARPLAEDLSGDRFWATESIRDLQDHLRQTAEPGEFILLKGTHADHIERIALAAEKPISCQIQRCGRRDSCFSCELLRDPAPRPLRYLTRKFRKIRAKNRRSGLSGRGEFCQ